jgi:2-(3-amino-3-carboxypropyl)histidine synthase
MSEYDFEINRVLGEIRGRGAKFVGLQFPEGLKEYAVEIAREIEEKSDATVVVFTDPVYGACDTKENEAGVLGVDLIVHFGHSSFK